MINENVNRAMDKIELLIRRMMKDRKQAEVEFYPYKNPIGYNPCWPSFDFNEVYSDWQEGDTGYIIADMPGPYERDMVISVTGESDIWFNGKRPEEFVSEKVPEAFKTHGIHSFKVKFLEGNNRLVVRQRAGSDYFKFELYIGVEQTPIMWVGGYIYKSRPIIPFGSMAGMEGMSYSKLYKKGEEPSVFDLDKIEWIGPNAPIDAEKIDFDFNDMTSYSVASALSYAKGEVKLAHKSPIRAFIDGRKVYDEESGVFTYSLDDEACLVVEADKDENGFGFEVLSGDFRIKQYDTDRKDLSWIWLEGVEDAASKIGFKEPFVCTDGKKTFFNYYRKDTYFRPYLNTSFFGQWFYAIMVGQYGLLKMAEKLGKKEYVEYFKASMKSLCDYFDYIQYDKEKFNVVPFMAGSTDRKDLDSIGTIGINVWEYYRLTNDEKAKYMLSVLAKSLDNVPRTDDDNTFYRIKTFWADDFFMSIPFLTRLGGEYVHEAAHHIRGFSKRLYMKDKKIFSHIYFVEEGKPNRIPWGRGNGWVMMALSEFLLHAPKDHPDRDGVLSLYRELSEGILSYQGESGMWHQVIDDAETYEESSGTGMFIIALARGVKNGWIGDEVVPRLWKAWNRLSETCIDKDGNALGICIGSGCHMEREYYKKLGACINDDHGIGVFLLAASELIELG